MRTFSCCWVSGAMQYASGQWLLFPGDKCAHKSILNHRGHYSQQYCMMDVPRSARSEGDFFAELLCGGAEVLKPK